MQLAVCCNEINSTRCEIGIVNVQDDEFVLVQQRERVFQEKLETRIRTVHVVCRT